MRWNLYRGDLELLRSTGEYTQSPGSVPLAWRWCNLDETSVDDPVEPVAGGVAFYLVTGTTVEDESDLGTDGQQVPRANDHACPEPAVGSGQPISTSSFCSGPQTSTLPARVMNTSISLRTAMRPDR